MAAWRRLRQPAAAIMGALLTAAKPSGVLLLTAASPSYNWLACFAAEAN